MTTRPTDPSPRPGRARRRGRRLCALVAAALPLLDAVAAEAAKPAAPAAPRDETRIRVTGTVHAPEAERPGADGRCPEGRRAVGDLGIDGLRFEGSLSANDDGGRVLSFRSEPRVLSVDPRGPAAGRLRDGDVIVALDGHLITTAAAGRLYSDPPIGRPVTITVRRAGGTRDVSVVPVATCLDADEGWPFDLPAPPAPPAEPVPDVPDVEAVAPAPAPAVVPRTPPTPATPAPPAPRARRVTRDDGEAAAADAERARADAQRALRDAERAQREAKAVVERERARVGREQERLERETQRALRQAEQAQRDYERAVARAWVERAPTAWTGLALTGDQVVMTPPDAEEAVVQFRRSPTIFSIDDDSPAARAGLARGDVLLLVDGRDVTSPDGSRRLAALEPGRPVELTVRRGERNVVVVLTPEEPSREAPVAPRRRPGPPVYRVRYSGELGGARIEVRGRDDTRVGISEEPGEVVIETGDTSIRIWLGDGDDTH